MPFTEFDKLGPLRALAGEWEGEGGLDVSFHHAEGEVGETAYREKITFNPFGPVDNGDQCLYGLDYRMAAWRGDEEDPFHTEVGYWLWCEESGTVMRAFMVPRGTVVLAAAEGVAPTPRSSPSAPSSATPCTGSWRTSTCRAEPPRCATSAASASTGTSSPTTRTRCCG